MNYKIQLSTFSSVVRYPLHILIHQDMYARCLIVPQPSDTDLVKALQILETAEYTCQSWGRTRLCQVTVWAAEVNGLIPPFVKRKYSLS